MASKITGSALPFRYQVETEFDPQYGDVLVERWNGPKSAIQLIAGVYRGNGYRVRAVYPPGAKGELEARIASVKVDGVTGAEIPHDTYELDFEQSQIPIWAQPNVAAKMALYANAALWRKDLEDAVKGGSAINPAQSGDTVAVAVYRLLSRGIESTTITKAVLTRKRTFSSRYAARTVLSVVPTIYTTARLVSDFGIPAQIAIQLPDESSLITPFGTAWSWMLHVNRSVWVAPLQKFEETKEWVFDCYDIVTNNLLS